MNYFPANTFIFIDYLSQGGMGERVFSLLPPIYSYMPTRPIVGGVFLRGGDFCVGLGVCVFCFFAQVGPENWRIFM